MQSIKYTQYFKYDHEGAFRLIAKTCSEFQDIAGTGMSVWLNLGFHSFPLTVPMAYECNWKKLFYVQSELFTLIQCMFI